MTERATNRFLPKILLFIFWLFLYVVTRAQPKLILPIGHTAEVSYACFSPDSKLVVTASADNTAKIWDAQSGALLADLKGNADRVTNAFFSPDGKKIITVGDTAKIWDTRTGNFSVTLKADSGRVSSASFSPDGKKIIIVTYDWTGKIYDAVSGEFIVELKGHYIYRAHFSPDSKKIVSSSEYKTAKVWDAASGILLADLKGTNENIAEDQIYTAYFSPDNKKVVTSSNDHTAKIWDAVNGQLLLDLRKHSEQVTNARFSPDGRKIVTASWDGTVKIWDALSGALLADLKGHTGYIAEASFSPDNKRVLTASGNIARIWDAQSGILMAELKGHLGDVNSASFSPDCKKIVTASNDYTARVWDAQNGILLLELKGHTKDGIRTAYFSVDGKKIVTASRLLVTKIWDTQTGTFSGGPRDSAKVNDITWFSPNGKTLIRTTFNKNEHTSELFDAVSGALLVKLKGQPYDNISGASYSPDGKKIVTAARDDTAQIWDALNGKLITELKGHNNSVTDACFSSDGKKIATASSDNTAKIWDAMRGTLLADLKGHTSITNTVNFSYDGTRIVTSSYDNSAKVWNAQSGVLLTDLKGHTGYVYSACFSPDNNRIVTASADKTGKIWDAKSGALVADLKGHSYSVNAAFYSPDNKTIVTASEDNTAKIWNAVTGSLLYTFFPLDSNDYFVQIPSGYYKCTPNAAKLLHYVDNDLKVISFEQLDVKYNRPDLVLQTMGSFDTGLIQSYKKAWQKRITKLGFDSGLFTGGFHVPEADIQNRDSIQYGQTSNKLSLQIKAKDTSVMLDRYNVWINEVPLFGIKGISLKSRNTKHFDTTILVTLSNGSNRIEASVTNVGGLESYRIPLDVKYTSPDTVREKLYFVGIGIDHFNDSSHNLRWSVKDIHNLVRNFKRKYGAACIIDTLFNNKVSIENVKALKQRLLATTENDKVIVAYSGHGLLSKDFDYFLSTYNVSFGEPEKAGLPYETLEDLLDGIPARKKLMLIDACHSGEVDKEELGKMVEVQGELDSTQKGGTPLIDTTHKKLGTKNSFDLMQEVFVNVGRNTGATVISAASGTQFALEMDGLKNGVFTHSIIELMKKNTTVTISELKKYVNQRVTELTHGVQIPTSRDENKVMDWEVW